MEITSSRSLRSKRLGSAFRNRQHLAVQSSGLANLYPNPLTFYNKSPTDVISLQDLDKYAVERLQRKFLTTFVIVTLILIFMGFTFSLFIYSSSTSCRKGGHDESRQLGETHSKRGEQSGELETVLKIGKSLFILHFRSNDNPSDFLFFQETPTSDDYAVQESVLHARKRDYLSHYILRLAYCRTESLRWWFVNQETDLFKYRLNRVSIEEKQEFLKSTDLKFEPVTFIIHPFQKEKLKFLFSFISLQIQDKEKRDRLQYLAEGTSSLFGNPNIYIAAERVHFYQVPFQNALELVRSRRGYLENGMVYVADADFNTIIVQKFRTLLAKTLTVTFGFVNLT
jgi:hypothetical protein